MARFSSLTRGLRGDRGEKAVLGQLPASTTLDDAFSGKPPTWKVARATDWVASRQGMGTGSDDAAILNSLLSLNATKRVIIDLPITFATGALLPNGALVEGFDYNGVVQSSVDTGASSQFKTFANSGWATNGAGSNITMRNLRIRHTETLLGSEGPYQGGCVFRLVDGLVLEHVVAEGGMSGFVIEGCPSYQLAHCRGEENGDSAFKVVRYGAGDPAERSSLIDCWGANSGYALDGVTLVPTPAGPLGSALVLTQDSLDVLGGGAINPKVQALETGDLVTDLKIDGFKAKADISGRTGNLLIANASKVELNEVTLEIHNGATAIINLESAGGQANSDITLKGCGGSNDDTTAGVDYPFINVGHRNTGVAISDCHGIGMGIRAGDSTSSQITVEDCTVRRARQQGYYFIGSAELKVKNCKAFNCGQDSSVAATQRAGFIIDTVPSDARFEDLYAADTQGGGATQQWGYYVNASSPAWINNRASSNVQGEITTTGTVALKTASRQGPRSFQSQRYYFPTGCAAASDGTDADGKNAMDLLPFVVGVRTRFDRIGTYLATAQANTNVRVGLYDTVAGLPYNLVVESGSLNSTAGAGASLEATIDKTLDPGLYWLGVVWQGTGATMPSITCVSPFTLRPEFLGVDSGNLANCGNLARYLEVSSGVTGALPDPCPTPTLGNSGPIRAGFLRAK